MMKTKLAISSQISLAILLTACAPGWEIVLLSPEQSPQPISYEVVDFYLEKSTEEVSEIPLGQVLYDNGYTLIDGMTFTMEGGGKETYEWDLIASDTTITSDGTVKIQGKATRPESIQVHPARHFNIECSIMDIAPTMAHALGLPKLPEAVGINRIEAEADYGVMILLDGLQYEKLTDLIKDGSLPFFQHYQEAIQMGLTVYPSISTSASAALLTSVPPQENGVFGFGYRSTESVTLFDVATEAGLSVKAVEGDSLAFNLRNAETMLSGDRDGDGFTDDNVFTNSLDVIETAMPDLLYIHFHNIDDQGHNFGPESPEYESAVIRVDSYLLDIYTKLPEGTLIVIFADHGMHVTEEGGNHGTLTSEDLIIPILFIEK
jgi:hypothetical protein